MADKNDGRLKDAMDSSDKLAKEQHFGTSPFIYHFYVNSSYS